MHPILMWTTLRWSGPSPCSSPRRGLSTSPGLRCALRSTIQLWIAAILRKQSSPGSSFLAFRPCARPPGSKLAGRHVSVPSRPPPLHSSKRRPGLVSPKRMWTQTICPHLLFRRCLHCLPSASPRRSSSSSKTTSSRVTATLGKAL